MKKLVTILAVLSVWTICSCDNRATFESEAKGISNNVDALYAASSSRSISEAPAQADKETGGQAADRVEQEHRKIIKQGDIRFKTADANKTRSLISQTVEELGGYISKDNSYGYSGRLEGSLVIRVPAGNFDLLLENISQNVDKFDNKNIDVLDVTEEYVDVAVRIKTKKELQARYVELLKKAAKIDEILSIEREIGKLQTEIESAEGRMKLLKDRVAFSTLTVSYYQDQKISHKFNFFSKFSKAIMNGLDMFLEFIIALSHLWVFMIITAATVCLVRFLKRRKKIKNNKM